MIEARLLHVDRAHAEHEVARPHEAVAARRRAAVDEVGDDDGGAGAGRRLL